MTTVDPEPVLRALLGANVQFVVLGEPEAEGSLRLVVSTHPTNLDALGRALDSLSATVRPLEPVTVGTEASTAPRRLVDPMGTVAVTTSAGDVVLFFGGQHAPLYAEAYAASGERVLAGVRVRWTPAPPDLGPAGRPTGKALGGRLISLAGRLAQLVDRRERDEARGDVDAPDAEDPQGG